MDVIRCLRIALLVAATAALTTATVLMVTQARVPATAVGPAPCLNGDVNGDSSLDIGDPIFLLGHLFGGGPAPIACAQTTPDDIAAAMDAALARYVPRAGERVYMDIDVLPLEAVDVVSVPPGKVFILEQVHVYAGSLTLPEKVVQGTDPSAGFLRPVLSFVPGEAISAINGHPNLPGALRLWGYWLDHAP